MKMTITRWIAALAVGLVMASGAAFAQEDASIIDKLNLTDAQKGQVKKLRDDFRSETEKLRTDIKGLLEEEKRLRQAGPANESALRDVLRRRADKEIELTLALTRFTEKLKGILTQDQKKLLEKLQQERKNNRPH